MMEQVNLRYIVRTFVNVMMYPQYNTNMIKKFLNNLKKKVKQAQHAYISKHYMVPQK
jgi:hypothetical protein